MLTSQLLSYSLTEVPSSIFKENGSKRITITSHLLHVLEKIVKESVVIEPSWNGSSACLIDAMAEIQSFTANKSISTFDDVGQLIINKLLFWL